jgi:hypothetical protein
MSQNNMLYDGKADAHRKFRHTFPDIFDVSRVLIFFYPVYLGEVYNQSWSINLKMRHDQYGTIDSVFLSKFADNRVCKRIMSESGAELPKIADRRSNGSYALGDHDTWLATRQER